MADISDVLTELTEQIVSFIYPSGIGGESLAGIPVVVYAGWPIPTQLNSDLTAGKAHVSVFPLPEERVKACGMNVWKEQSINAPTLTLEVDGNRVTVGGEVAIPQACMIVLNGTAYSYGVAEGDTLESIAAGIAALIPSATSDGEVITCPDAKSLTTEMIVAGTSAKEIRRQERTIQIAVWSPTATARDTISKIIDFRLANMKRLALPDQNATLVYKQSPLTASTEQPTIYRRDLIYSVEYSMFETETNYTVGHTDIDTALNLVDIETGQSQ